MLLTPSSIDRLVGAMKGLGDVGLIIAVAITPAFVGKMLYGIWFLLELIRKLHPISCGRLLLCLGSVFLSLVDEFRTHCYSRSESSPCDCRQVLCAFVKNTLLPSEGSWRRGFSSGLVWFSIELLERPWLRLQCVSKPKS